MDAIIQNCGVEGRRAVKVDHGWKQHADYAFQDHAVIIFFHIIMSPRLSIRCISRLVAKHLDQATPRKSPTDILWTCITHFLLPERMYDISPIAVLSRQCPLTMMPMPNLRQSSSNSRLKTTFVIRINFPNAVLQATS